MRETPFPYQIEGGNWMAGRARAGLFDRPGLGKTATSILTADYLQARRVAVVCPAAARQVWVGEFPKFGLWQRRVCKAKDIYSLHAWLRGHFDTLVMGYEQASKWTKEIVAAGASIDALFLDEAHYLKNPGAMRSTALLGRDANGFEGLASLATRAYWLTGTPMPNDPSDIYSFLRFCYATPLDYKAFLSRYFHARATTYGARTTPRLEMIPELRAMIDNNVKARSLADVGIQLPPVLMSSITLDGDTQAVADILTQHPGLDRQIINAVESGGLSTLDAPYIATLRRLIGEAKAVPYGHLLVSELKGTEEKQVVMALHRQAIQTVADILRSHGIGCVVVNGDTPEAARVAAVRDFQNDRETRVFLANIRTAGTALTLTKAARLDMLESDWTPAANYQAIKRVDRIGQSAEKVLVRFVMLANSIDQGIVDIVVRKARDIARLDREEMRSAPSTELAPAA